LAILYALAKEGCNVVSTDINIEEVKQIADGVKLWDGNLM